MLQQTQVATVIPYYERFRRALSRCARAGVGADRIGDGVLGRTRVLLARAQFAPLRATDRSEYTAESFRADVERLAQLPGIGRSTAAAIAALAFGERAAILDGNVRRVLARHCGIEGYPGSPKIEREFWQCAESLLPGQRDRGLHAGPDGFGCNGLHAQPSELRRMSRSTTRVSRAASRRSTSCRPRALSRERPVRAQTVLADAGCERRRAAGTAPAFGNLGRPVEPAGVRSSKPVMMSLVAAVGARFGLRIDDYRSAWRNTARVHALHVPDAAAARAGDRHRGRREPIPAARFSARPRNCAAAGADSPVVAARDEPPLLV